MYGSLETVVQRAKALIFDFDGTLVDSNPIKLYAFEKCFSDFVEKQSEIMDYCLAHHHVSRFDKFRHVFETILHRPYTPEWERKMLRRYAEETTEQVIGAPEIPGAVSFVKRWKKKKEVVLLSTTPDEILKHILARREMEHLFSVIRGAPVHKASWMDGFMRGRGLEKREVVFFGDSDEDAESAKTAGVIFVKVEGDQTFRS
ncbi:MAG: HAD hydrolase-like protein [Deltaproteobacteria bacterium]|nr:HAD hydrolase-like protein [Deltaproteobacteria bacterium]MBI4223733.1 HAD hydrolase-like protein [Deltaproteobacteria bacterium]